MYDRYMAEIGSHHDPSDPRLSLPLKVINGGPGPFVRDEKMQCCIRLPNDVLSTVLEMTVMLVDIIRHVDHSIGSTTFKYSFTGQDIVKSISAVFEVSNDEASKFSIDLLFSGLFSSMGNALYKNKDTRISLQAIYRMKCFETPYILNSFCAWTEKVDLNYMRLISRLTNIMNSIQMDKTDKYGVTSLERIIKHADFPMFEEAICELQGVHLSQMNDATKIAFGINLYNLMMQYAILKIGTPDAKGKSSRAEYVCDVKFNVGGYLYSFYEWEHGILRGNTKGSSCDGTLPSLVPFGRKDPRIAYIVTNPDPRIHFAIYHGTNSCPSIRRYSASNIDEELTIATKSFCEKEKNVRFNETKNEIQLSKIFTWYRMDFVSDAKLLPKWVSQYSSGSLKHQLDFVLESNSGAKSIKVVDIAFDWSMKSSWVYGVLQFEVDSLKMNRHSHISGLLPKSSVSQGRAIRGKM